MLAKLIKYDFKALSEKYILMLIVLAVTCIIGSSITFIGKDILTGILLFIAVLFTVGVFIVFCVLAVMYLYNTLSGKKSGFTHTLPVNIHYIVLSKIVNIIVWAAITAIVVILFWFIFYKALVANSSILDSFIASIKNEIYVSFGEEGFNNILLTLVGDIVFQFIGSISLVVFCVSLTCHPKFKNSNIGIAVGVIGYFVIYYILNFLFAGIFILTNTNILFGNNDIGIEESIAIIKQLSTLVILSWSVLSVAFYFISSYMFLHNKNV